MERSSASVSRRRMMASTSKMAPAEAPAPAAVAGGTGATEVDFFAPAEQRKHSISLVDPAPFAGATGEEHPASAADGGASVARGVSGGPVALHTHQVHAKGAKKKKQKKRSAPPPQRTPEPVASKASPLPVPTEQPQQEEEQPESRSSISAVFNRLFGGSTASSSRRERERRQEVEQRQAEAAGFGSASEDSGAEGYAVVRGKSKSSDISKRSSSRTATSATGTSNKGRSKTAAASKTLMAKQRKSAALASSSSSSRTSRSRRRVASGNESLSGSGTDEGVSASRRRDRRTGASGAVATKTAPRRRAERATKAENRRGQLRAGGPAKLDEGNALQDNDGEDSGLAFLQKAAEADVFGGGGGGGVSVAPAEANTGGYFASSSSGLPAGGGFSGAAVNSDVTTSTDSVTKPYLSAGYSGVETDDLARLPAQQQQQQQQRRRQQQPLPRGASSNMKKKSNAPRPAKGGEELDVDQLLPQKGETVTGSEFDQWGMDEYQIDASSVQILRPLGEGFFGIVHEGLWNGQPVAVKKLKQNVREGEMANFKKEAQILSKLRHHNVVTFYGVTSPPDAMIVSELLCGSAFDLLYPSEVKLARYPSLSQPLPHSLLRRIVLDVAQGVAYLHSRNPAIIHRDLSSANVLLTSLDLNALEAMATATTAPIAKLSDFGLSRQVEWYMTSCVGNCFYLSPEVFAGDKYDWPADIYSFSILMWELFARERPLKDLNPQRAAFMTAVKGVRPEIDERFPTLFASLIPRCWAAEPDDRPSSQNIVDILRSTPLDQTADAAGQIHNDQAGTEEGQQQPLQQQLQPQQQQEEEVYNTFSRADKTREWIEVGRVLSAHLQARPPLWRLMEKGILPATAVDFTQNPASASGEGLMFHQQGTTQPQRNPQPRKNEAYGTANLLWGEKPDVLFEAEQKEELFGNPQSSSSERSASPILEDELQQEGLMGNPQSSSSERDTSPVFHLRRRRNRAEPQQQQQQKPQQQPQQAEDPYDSDDESTFSAGGAVNDDDEGDADDALDNDNAYMGDPFGFAAKTAPAAPVQQQLQQQHAPASNSALAEAYVGNPFGASEAAPLLNFGLEEADTMSGPPPVSTSNVNSNATAHQKTAVPQNPAAPAQVMQQAPPFSFGSGKPTAQSAAAPVPEKKSTFGALPQQTMLGAAAPPPQQQQQQLPPEVTQAPNIAYQQMVQPRPQQHQLQHQPRTDPFPSSALLQMQQEQQHPQEYQRAPQSSDPPNAFPAEPLNYQHAFGSNMAMHPAMAPTPPQPYMGDPGANAAPAPSMAPNLQDMNSGGMGSM